MAGGLLFKIKPLPISMQKLSSLVLDPICFNDKQRWCLGLPWASKLKSESHTRENKVIEADKEILVEKDSRSSDGL